MVIIMMIIFMIITILILVMMVMMKILTTSLMMTLMIICWAFPILSSKTFQNYHLGERVSGVMVIMMITAELEKADLHIGHDGGLINEVNSVVVD